MAMIIDGAVAAAGHHIAPACQGSIVEEGGREVAAVEDNLAEAVAAGSHSLAAGEGNPVAVAEAAVAVAEAAVAADTLVEAVGEDNNLVAAAEEDTLAAVAHNLAAEEDTPVAVEHIHVVAGGTPVAAWCHNLATDNGRRGRSVPVAAMARRFFF